MRTFTFSTLPPLQDFQFLTDSSGYVLTQTGQLYHFVGQRPTLVETPSQFTISHFYFRDQTHGAVVGIAPAAAPPTKEGAVGTAAIPLLLLLWLAWKGRRQLATRRLTSSLGLLLLASGLLLSCSSAWQRYRTPDPTSPHATLLAHAPLAPLSFHRYFANKDQQSFIALTQARTSEIWVTMAGRKPHLSHGNLGYVALPTKRLLRFAAGQWQPVIAPPFTSFEQVAFVPGTSTGYLLGV